MQKLFKRRLIAQLLVFVMVFSVFASAMPVTAGEGVNHDGYESSVSINLPPPIQDLPYNDGGILAITLTGSVGMQGFEGPFALGDDPDEIVEIIVQFVTPPAEALRLLSERGSPHARLIPGMSFSDMALFAHDEFLQQLASIPMPLSDAEQIEIFCSTYWIFNGVHMRLPAGIVAQIAALPEVFAVTPYILPEVPVITAPSGSPTVLDAVAPSGPPRPSPYFTYDGIMRNTRTLLNLDVVHLDMSITGTNVVVASIDTGIDHGHPEFIRFHDSTDRVPGWEFWYDGSPTNHGTQTAGAIIAMAPNVELWSLQRAAAGVAGGTAIGALNFATQTAQADVIYTWGWFPNSPFSPDAYAVSMAVEAGHVVVAAVHNQASPNNQVDPSWWHSNGFEGVVYNNITWFSVLNPLSPLSINVAAGTFGSDWNATVNGFQILNSDHATDFTGRGPVPRTFQMKPDIMTNGLFGTVPWDRNDTEGNPDGLLHGWFSGTSQAGPLAAGMAALLVQAFPTAPPHEIKARLMNTGRPLAGVDLGNPAQFLSSFTVGAGFARPYYALQSNTVVTVAHDVPLTANQAAPWEERAMASFSFGSLATMPASNVQSFRASINNRSGVSITYTIDHDFVNNPSNAATITLSQRTITVEAGQTGHFYVAISVAGNVPGGVTAFYEGNIYIIGGSHELRLPFALVNPSTTTVNANLLSFDLNGGEITLNTPDLLSTIDSINVLTGADILPFLYNNHDGFPSSNPTKDNHGFAGWYLDAGFTTPVTVTSTMPSAATTLYARWIPLGATLYGDIVGYTDVEIIEQEVTITLSGDTFAATLPGGNWITNLPDGLNQTVRREDDTTVVITVTGAPEEESDDEIEVTIPIGALVTNSGISVNATSSVDAMFDIAEATFELDWDGVIGTFSELDFGYDVGSSVEFFVRNTGNQPVAGITAAITTGNDYFIAGEPSATTVNPGESIAVIVATALGLDADTYDGVLTITWTGGAGATGIIQDLEQIVNRINYPGLPLTAADSVIADELTTDRQLTLPTLPPGAAYAATGAVGGATALISAHSIAGGVLTFSTTAQPAGTTATITIPVTGATNFNDFEVVVTITALDFGATISGNITGYTGVALTGTQQVTVNLVGDEFAPTLSGNWIANLPVGLTQSVTRMNDTTAVITVSGTPTEASSEQIAVTIPAGALVTNSGTSLPATGVATFGIVLSTFVLEWDGVTGTFEPLDFGYADGNNVTFTIRNTGNQPITNIAAVISVGSNYFVAGNLSATTLAPNSTATITVTTALGLNAGTHDGVLTITWAGGAGAAGITQPLLQTVNRIAYPGTTAVSDNVIADQVTTNRTLNLPTLPTGASHATTGTVGGATALISGHSIAGGVLTFSTTAQTPGTEATITIPVTGAVNYEDFNVIVTITAVELGATLAGNITGYTGVALTGTQQVTVNLVGDDFADPLPAGNWITNLPAGLTQSVARVNADTAVITVEGTPTAASSAQIAVTIPVGALVDNSDMSLAATSGAGAVFAIETATFILEWDGVIGTFAPLYYGYATGSSVTFTIRNAGNQPITGIAAAITAGGSYFAAGNLSATTLAPGATATITVTSQLGLNAGTYGGVLTITGDNATNITQNLSQVVNRAVFTGNTSIRIEVLSNTSGSALRVTLPVLPEGATYGTPTTTSNGLVDPGSVIISGNSFALYFDFFEMPESVSDTISIPVTGAINFQDFTFTVVVAASDNPQEAIPNAVINFITERLTGLTPGRGYSINGVPLTADAYGSIGIDPAWFGTTLNIILLGVAPSIDSEPQVLPIPNRPAAPTGVAATDTTDGQNNGTITGVTNLMEFRPESAGAWTPITTEPTVTGLASGTYEVRFGATTTAFASLSATVTVGASTAPAPSASIGNTTIGNAGGNVVITLTDDTFLDFAPGAVTWITNLPAGMTQTATRTNATQVTIAISGTPTVASTAQIAVTIPAASLTTSTTNLVAALNPQAVFNTTVATIVHPPAQEWQDDTQPAATPTPRLTIPANHNAVAVNVRVAHNRVTLTIPASALNQIVETAENNIVVFDISAFPNATTIVLPRTAMQRFLNEEFEVIIIWYYGMISLSAYEIAALLQQIRTGNITVNLELPPLVVYQPAPASVMRFSIGSVVYDYNGVLRAIEAAPFIDGDRTMVPLRFIAEAMGAQVQWIGETGTIIIIKNGVQLQLTVGVPLPGDMGTPVIVADRAFVPARYVSEMLGAEVRWDDGNVYIYLP